MKALPFNGAPAQPEVSGRTYTWQMQNLPPLEREPSAPSALSLVPWVGVSLIGTGAKRAALSWPEVAKQLYELNEGQELTPSLTEKAQALTQSSATELDKIRAIGRFAQQVNYVSIQVNVAKGGGYRPHAASEVLQKFYGDCKDKANLTRTLLRAAGITAFPVAIYAGDRTRVTRDWPSFGSFNHAIVAIRVKPETEAPAILDHPKLGRLLFFDPTDPYVPPGYLPDHEQGSLALVADANNGDIVTVPSGSVEPDAHHREIEATLGPDGTLTGSLTEIWSGEALAEALAWYRGRSSDEFNKQVESRLAHSVPGVRLASRRRKRMGDSF
jgi:hypothetical protein